MVRKIRYGPFMRSSSGKSIFCSATVGSAIALDLQEKLKP